MTEEPSFQNHLLLRQRQVTTPLPPTPQRASPAHHHHQSQRENHLLPKVASPDSKTEEERRKQHERLRQHYLYPPKLVPLPSLRHQHTSASKAARGLRPSSSRGLKLPSLQMSLRKQTLADERYDPSACSPCRATGERCLRESDNVSCEMCHNTNTLCDLPGMQAFHRPTKGSSAHKDGISQQYHNHHPLSTRAPLPSTLQQEQHHSNLVDVNLHPLLHDPSRRLSHVHPLFTNHVVHLSEVRDKFKLPRASFPPPPPDAPAFSPVESSSRIPGPLVPSVHPTVYTTGAQMAISADPADPTFTKSAPTSACNPVKQKLWTEQAQVLQRSLSDPYLLPARESTTHSPVGAASSFAYHATEIRGDVPYSASHYQETAERNFHSELNYPQASTSKLPHSAMQDMSDTPNKLYHDHSSYTESTSAYNNCHKRPRSISPEDPPFPEDIRGTAAKRPRKTLGPWTPRRPQTACDTCRAKKIHCTVQPGHTSCDRCTLRRLVCSRPSFKPISDLPAESSETSGSFELSPFAIEILFRESDLDKRIPPSLLSLTYEDWSEIRKVIISQMCSVLSNCETELWEEFKNTLPPVEHLKNLIYSYFATINPAFPVIHAATFDARTVDWELTLTLACLAQHSDGAFIAASILREALLAALATRSQERSHPASQPILAIEQAVLLLSAFTIMPKSGLPSQWPRDFDTFFSKFTVEEQVHTWEDWILQEMFTRTAFGFYYINLFRHVLTLNTDGRTSSVVFSGQPYPSRAWCATTSEEFQNTAKIGRIHPESLVTHILKKTNNRMLFISENTFYFQVAVLRQAYAEKVALTRGGTHENSLCEQGRVLTARLDDIFACPNIAKLRMDSWKPDLLALFLLHHAVALVRIQPIAVLCQLAEGSAVLKQGDATFREQESTKSAHSFWRAALILQAIQQASTKQRQNLVVPYALFVSVMFMCTIQNLPSSSHDRSAPRLIHLAAHHVATEGELQKYIQGRVKRVPAIMLRSSKKAVEAWGPDTRIKLLQECIDMMEDFRLPDRSARAFRDLLKLRLHSESAILARNTRGHEHQHDASARVA